ncbi:MAG: FHA domain-containing protein [Burkholderiaceae bacterium]|nr:FHA domain-containing protein [Burkholderiaceae bacterium]
MGKIIIARDGIVEQEIALSKERMTVGRRSHNDIVLSHPAVSGEHAVITTILDDSFLEDLRSTNGTFVNGQRIGKHFLRHGDAIKLATYRIAYLADGVRPQGAAPADTTVPLPPAAVTAPGRVEVLNGANAGKQLALTKPLTTLGRPVLQVVVISRGVDAYAIAQVEGDAPTLVNGALLGKQPMRLKNGDIIDLSGTQMAFRQD